MIRFACSTAFRLLLLGGLAATAACGRDNGGGEGNFLERITASTSEAPDEFLSLPRKPLEVPPDLAALPEPQPGTVSRAELTPRSDARVALGGSADGGGSGADAAFLAAAGVQNRAAGIRETLSAEDEVWRQNNRGKLLNRLLGRVGEADIYAAFLLDPDAEADRLRDAGLRVPQQPLPRRR